MPGLGGLGDKLLKEFKKRAITERKEIMGLGLTLVKTKKEAKDN